MSFASGVEPNPIGAKLELYHVDTCVEHGLVCHIHFPGSSTVVSLLVPSTKCLRFSVPRDATAVCVTLALRFYTGWLRHSRCRFSGIKCEELNLKDEQLNDRFGKAKLTLDRQIVEGLPPLLIREWFHPLSDTIPSARGEQNADVYWHDDLEPYDETISKLHIGGWNNNTGSVPGWYFAFPPHTAQGYSRDDLEAVFGRAYGMLNKEPCDAHQFSFTTSAYEAAAVVALGLSIFGQSITYLLDKNTHGIPVERFSSTARLDGVGDCEDMAKESALAYGDLVKISELDENKYNDTPLMLIKLSSTARCFQFCIVLSTVRRTSDAGFLAHAFGMMIPNGLFPPDYLEQSTATSTTDRKTFMCDGTYDCHPTKHKRSKDTWEGGKNDQLAPWEYQMVASAFVFNRGQVYFRFKGQVKYGVPFSEIFPVMGQDVECVDALEAQAQHLRAEASFMLQSNLPRATRMFGYESLAPLELFDQVATHTEGRPSNIIQTFDNMNAALRRSFTKMGKKISATCLNTEGFREMHDLTEKQYEVAFQIGSEGGIENRSKGKWGGVVSPPVGNNKKGVPVTGGHTHHRLGPNVQYRERSPPTPSDYAAFVESRVWSLMSMRSGVTQLALHEAAIIVQHNCVYSMNETGRSDDIVTCAFITLGVQEFATVKKRDVRDLVKKMIKKRINGNRFLTNPVNPYDFDYKVRDDKIFKKGESHDSYLKLFEEKIGVSVVCETNEEYEETCGISPRGGA